MSRSLVTGIVYHSFKGFARYCVDTDIDIAKIKEMYIIKNECNYHLNIKLTDTRNTQQYLYHTRKEAEEEITTINEKRDKFDKYLKKLAYDIVYMQK